MRRVLLRGVARMRRSGGRVWRGGGWLLTLWAWVVAGCVLVAMVWARFPGVALRLGIGEVWWWRGEVVSSFLVPMVVVGVGLAAVVGVLRVWAALGVLVLGVVVGASGPASVPRVLWAGEVSMGGERGEGVVRVLHWNVGLTDRRTEAFERLLAEADADVVVLVEGIGGFHRSLREGEGVSGGYAHRYVPRGRGVSNRVILSRFGLSGADGGALPVRVTGVAHALASTPFGDVAIAAVHPLSPRTPWSARTGNERVAVSSDELRGAYVGRGVPLMVSADLNASPGTSRARRLHAELGLRPSKPLLRLGGTWPTDGWRVSRVAIDDVWVGDGVRVVGWSALEVEGSDHLAVVVDLRFEGAASGR